MAVNSLDPILWVESVITAYDAATDLVAVLPNLWHDHAEQEEAFPYGVFHEITNIPDHMFGGASIENVLVQFSLFDNQSSHARLSTAIAQLYIAFDGAALTPSDVTRYSHMEMSRKREGRPRWAAENVWQVDLDYTMQFWRSAS